MKKYIVGVLTFVLLLIFLNGKTNKRIYWFYFIKRKLLLIIRNNISHKVKGDFT